MTCARVRCDAYEGGGGDVLAGRAPARGRARGASGVARGCDRLFPFTRSRMNGRRTPIRVSRSIFSEIFARSHSVLSQSTTREYAYGLTEAVLVSELGSRNSPRSGLARGMDAHALARAPVPGVYLLYDFHTAAEESYLLSRVDNEPKTRWTTVSDRRVLQFGGRPTATKHGMIAEKIPEWLLDAFYTLVPIRPHSRGERRSLRTFLGASLRPPLAFSPRPRRLSTPTDAFQLHPDVRSYGTTLTRPRRRDARGGGG